MSSVFKNNDWNNHVALVIHLPVDQAQVQQINNGAFNYLNDSAIELTVNNLQNMFGSGLKITKIQTFKSPFTQAQLTSFIGYHEYAVIETQNQNHRIYWSTEKNGERIWLTAFDNLEKCRDFGPTNERRYKQQYWKPEVKRKEINPSNSDFYDLVRWVYKQSRNEKDYGFFTNSSKKFIDNLFNKFK